MKIITYLFALLFLNICLSQTKDTIDIAFKAKFLTTSIYGITDKENFVEEIQKQKLEFIAYKESNNFVFMKIEFNQKYTDFYRNAYTAWLGNCFYYLAFNKNKSKFYRLGGFDTLDINEFVKDLYYEEDFYLFDEELSKEISIFCIKFYHDLSERKKNKLGYSCFPKCLEKLTTDLIVN